MVAPNLLQWARRLDSASKKHPWHTIKRPNYENRKPQVVSPLVKVQLLKRTKTNPKKRLSCIFSDQLCWHTLVAGCFLSPYMVQDIILLFRASPYQHPGIMSLTVRNSSHFSVFGNLALQPNLPPVLLIDSKEELLRPPSQGNLD